MWIIAEPQVDKVVVRTIEVVTGPLEESGHYIVPSWRVGCGGEPHPEVPTFWPEAEAFGVLDPEGGA